MSGPLRDRIRIIGLVGGPALAVAMWLLLRGAGADLDPPGRMTLAVMVWMATWWLTEAIDVAATALLPLMVLPLVGAATMREAAAPYADPLIFLFMGGFLLAGSMQRWHLDRRIALVTLRLVGTRPANLVGGVMLVTAVLSMFVSNTATAAMMLPIALSVVALVRSTPPGDGADGKARPGLRDDSFALCLMLGIAYAATIGGIGTKIGTPPNGLLLAFIEQTYDRQIGFLQWLAVGLPLVAVFLPLTWFFLTRWAAPVPREPVRGAARLLGDAYRALGRPSAGEWATFVMFTLTASAWVLRPLLNDGIVYDGRTIVPAIAPRLTDAGIAMLGAGCLFVIPVGRRPLTFALDWPVARAMPWGVFILFGGGLSLAAAVQRNGVAEFFGGLAATLAGWPPLLLVLIVATAVILLTELTSNTATTATLLPVLAAVAPGLGVHPFLLIVPAALAASCAFMMPVATPPNAIVFGSGNVTIPQMCRAGIGLNLIGVLLITAITWFVVTAVLGFSPTG